MVNDRLEAALAWCRERNIKIGSDRLNLFDRYYKSKMSKKNRNRPKQLTGYKMLTGRQ